MFVDTSAIVEALIAGPQADRIASTLISSETALVTGPTVVYEASAVIASKHDVSVPDAESIVRGFIRDFDISLQPITDETASIALDAFARYGKGRHPAWLNFGDCFSYAGAGTAQVPLFYVGNDFARTELA